MALRRRGHSPYIATGTRQVLSAHMSLTSVFGMGSDGSAAGGGCSDLNEWQRSVGNEAAGGKAHTGHRNRKQVDPHDNQHI